MSDSAKPALDSKNSIFQLLERLALGAQVAFDPVRANQAIRKAEIHVPPTQNRAARTRVQSAVEDIGLELLNRQLSVREALSVVNYDSILAIFTLTPDGSARWFVLTEARSGMGHLITIGGDPEGEWLKAADIAYRLGVSNTERVLEWLLPKPATTLLDYQDPAQDVNAQLMEEDDHHHHDSGISPLSRVLSLLKPERKDVWVVILFAVGIGIFNLATPITAMAVVNTVALLTLSQQVFVLSLALLVALGLAAILQMLQTITVEYLQQRIFVRVVDDLAYRIPRVDTQAFDTQHGPELMNRFFAVLTVQKASATLLLDGITIILQIIIGLSLLGFYDNALIGYDIVLILCLMFMVFVLGRGAVSTSLDESRAKYAVAGWIEEIARHPIAFKLNGGTQFVVEKADQLSKHYLLARQSHFRKVMRQFGFALFLQAVANAGLLALGGYLVAQGQLTLGQLVAAEIVVTLVVASFTKFGKQLDSYYDLLAGADKLGHLIDLPLERAGGVPHTARTDGARIHVKDISYSYGHHPSVIQHLSFHLEPGERVALAGPNGSGKSTLIDILFGMRPPYHGRVEIDDMDVRDLRLDSLREHVAAVKSPEIFEGTIIANIRMGREHFTIADVRHALRQVGLLDSILELPRGLNTKLWTGGAPLSMGQVNRLMLARAIIGQPRLLILDETLDHMDTDIRENVIPAIMGRDARWTLLVATHSEEVIRLCDRAIRLDKPAHVTLEHAH